MVYYGAPSKGCERCRQRKIKCDQRKPGCLRCEKAKTPCPGFRNLGDITFRDESTRVIRKARASLAKSGGLTATSTVKRADSRGCTIAQYTSISPIPIPPVDELAGQFFFAKYTCTQVPFTPAYNDWLTQQYHNDVPGNTVRVIIQAIGMAGISNVLLAPHIAEQSKARYVQALAGTNLALNDSNHSLKDTTVVSIILLWLFEFITSEGLGYHRSWTAHIEGATTLLQLRGQAQFNHERGEQLFAQLRSQILYTCIVHDIVPPRALQQVSRDYRASVLGERRMRTLPAPLNSICLRYIELRSSIKKGETKDPEIIRAVAIEIENDLKAWRSTLPQQFNYATIEVSNAPPDTYFGSKRHIYSDLAIVHIWNNWRAMCILTRVMILRNTTHADVLDTTPKSSSLSLVRQLATEICISAPDFEGSVRAATLIWPLSIVAQESLIPLAERCWAIKQLRRIFLSLGIRQAALLADAYMAVS